MNKKILKKMLAATILIGGVNFLPVNFSVENLQVVSVAHAEMQTFVGDDVAMFDFGENDTQVVNTVKNVARNRAIQVAKEKAGVYVTSFSQTVNGILTKDDISAVTNNISEILDVKYERSLFNTLDANGNPYGKVGIMYKATVTAKIDTNGISEYLQKTSQEKEKIIQQNKNLQDSMLKADNDFEDSRMTSSSKNLEQIKSELNKVDKEMSANGKISEGNKLAYQGNYSDAISKYNEAVQVDTNNFYAQDNVEIIEGKSILPDSSDAKYYYNRGVAYFDSKDYEKALLDFEMVIKLETNFKKAHWYKEICEKKIAESGQNSSTSQNLKKRKKSLPGANKTLNDLQRNKKKNSDFENTLGLALELYKIFKK